MTAGASLDLQWTCKSLQDLTAAELYSILQLRNEVFVVEQDCVYQDADGKDAVSLHLCGWQEGRLAAYARILPPGTSYDSASIGRVVTAPFARRAGAGRTLMEKAIATTLAHFNTQEITISAQTYLEKFYQSLGFYSTGTPYLEDGIPHITMCLKK